MKREICILGLSFALVFALLARAGSVDRRHEDGRFSMARYEYALQTMPADANAAVTATVANVCGTIKAIEVITTDTEDSITYTVALTNQNSTSLFSEAALTDNSQHWRDSESSKGTPDADFNPIPVFGTLTATITPSADPDDGGVGAKIATVQVNLYVE